MISFLRSFHGWGLALLAALHFSALVNIATCTSAAYTSHFTQFCNWNYTTAREKRFTEGRNFITNGTRVYVGTYQFNVFVLKKTNTHSKCSGTILDEYHILTAAHCVLNLPRSHEEYDLILIAQDNSIEYLKANIFNKAAEFSQMYYNQDGPAIVADVESAYVHSAYDVDRIGNFKSRDIAVLRLQKPLIFNDTVRPVCLASPTDEPVPQCTAFGYGNNGTNITITTNTNPEWYLYYADGLNVYTSEQRRDQNLPNKLKTVFRTVEGIHIEDMVAFNGESDKGICGGDSGGPLMCKVSDSSSEYMKQFAINQAIVAPNGCGMDVLMFFEPVQLHLDWLEFVALPTLDPNNTSKGKAPVMLFLGCQNYLNWTRLEGEVNAIVESGTGTSSYGRELYLHMGTSNSSKRLSWVNSICRSYVAYLTCKDNHHTPAACDNMEPILSDPVFGIPLLPYFTELNSKKFTTPEHTVSSTAERTHADTTTAVPTAQAMSTTAPVQIGVPGHTDSPTPRITPAPTPRNTPSPVPAGHTHAPKTTAAPAAKTPKPARKDVEASETSAAVKPSSAVSVLIISTVLVLVALA